MAVPSHRIMYIEKKSGHGDRGPARIGLAKFSRTGRTVRYGGRSFQRHTGGGVSGNFFDVETGDEYWISGPKKNGEDRHWAGGGSVAGGGRGPSRRAGGGPVAVDADIAEQYWAETRGVAKPADPLNA